MAVTCWMLNYVYPEHGILAPAVGFEPTTNRLTADRSTTELRWIATSRSAGVYFARRFPSGNCESGNADYG